MNHYSHERLALAQRIAAFLTIKRKQPPPRADVRSLIQQDIGRARAAALAKYLAGQASALRWAWDAAVASGNPLRMAEAAHLQAGAASADAMSDLLLSAVSNDRQGFKEAFAAFINDAVDSGVVPA